MDVESAVEVALVSICVQPPFSSPHIYDVAPYVIYTSEVCSFMENLPP